MSLNERLILAAKLLVFIRGNIAGFCCRITPFVQSLRFKLPDCIYLFPERLLTIYGQRRFSIYKWQKTTQLYGSFRRTTYCFYFFSLNRIIPDQDCVT